MYPDQNNQGKPPAAQPQTGQAPAPSVSAKPRAFWEFVAKKKLVLLIAAVWVVVLGGGLPLALALTKAQTTPVDSSPVGVPMIPSVGQNSQSPAASTSTTDNTAAQSSPATTGSSTTSGGSKTTSSSSSTPKPATYTTYYTSKCYQPADITIKKGDIVQFINNSTRDMWPAYDNHPNTDAYTEFDAKQAIAPGGVYSFTFTKVGTWNYADRLKPSCTGTITVN